MFCDPIDTTCVLMERKKTISHLVTNVMFFCFLRLAIEPNVLVTCPRTLGCNLFSSNLSLVLIIVLSFKKINSFLF